jgi:uncharacterized membrane protein
MLPARRAFLLLALLASALIAGFFYSYSISVMPGLLATDSISAVRAMQGINATIRTPVFAFAFFGALVFPLLAALFSRERIQLALLAGAVLAYGAGALGVTFLVSVPMNEALATQTPAAATASAIWHAYEIPWSLWNHLRAVASTVAFGLVAAAVVREWQAR